MAVDRSSAQAPGRRSARGDHTSRRWVEQLHPGHPRHEHAAARLHDVPQRAAMHELQRRRGQLKGLSGPELDDVAQQCADDAMMKILARVDDFQGLSRFTTWAYKFVIFEVFVAIALNEVPIDALALQLDSNRNAIYKNLFDARRKPGCRRPPTERRGGARMTDLRDLDELLRAQEGDAGCDAGVPIMDQYVEIELRDEDPSARFPGTSIHLRVCPGCRADHDGVLAAARRLGDVEPE